MGRKTVARRQKDGPGRADTRVAAVAARQRGLATARQLAALGLDAAAVRRRVLAGRLHPVHRGVYAVGHRGLTFEARALATVLACGPRALLSHRAAAVLWGVSPSFDEPFEVTTTSRGRTGPAGVVVHRVRRLEGDEHTILHGIPVTTLPRTLLDLATIAPRSELERTIREAHAQRLIRPESLLSFVERARGRPGAPALRDAVQGDDPRTRSRIERRFLTLCRQAGVPPPEVDVRLHGLTVDFLWRDEGLVVETDGFGTHGTRHGFEDDRDRDGILARAGLRTLRFSPRQLDERPGEVVTTVVAVRAGRLKPAGRAADADRACSTSTPPCTSSSTAEGRTST